MGWLLDRFRMDFGIVQVDFGGLLPPQYATFTTSALHLLERFVMDFKLYYGEFWKVLRLILEACSHG